MFIQWNTQRKYTTSGQVLRAARLPDRSVLFADDTRGIDGHIDPQAAHTLLGDDPTEEQLRQCVMHCYDKGYYTSDEQSFAFLKAGQA